MGKEEKKEEKCCTKLKETATEKVKEVDMYVKKHPYKTVGIVAAVSAGVGAIVGFLFRSKK